ncbi:MAG: RluA family pseudouridine synthase [Gammaproteobacteria bacterium]|nr:RluA family pseudouridine synthase [Gammaproteobacteria bacterium]
MGAYHKTVTEDFAGQRLDNYLLRELKNVPRTRIYRAIRGGEVRVNKGRTKPSYRLQAGDELRLPPLASMSAKPKVRLTEQQILQLQERIVYRQGDLLVVDKPAGIAVHAGSGVRVGLIEMMRELKGMADLNLVHRLDRETSGCLLMTTSRAAMLALHAAIRDRQLKKCYLALVKGHWPKDLTRVDLPLRRHQLRGGERLVEVDAVEGKPAQTIFKPLRYFQNTTLVHVELITGRTHQIRVHATASGYPLAGDDKYGDSKFNAMMRKLGLRRLFLHAFELGVPTVNDLRAVHLCVRLAPELIQLLSDLHEGCQ